MIKCDHNPQKIQSNIKGAYLKASATVEGAIVIPILLFAVMTIMHLLQVVAIETKVHEALYETVRRCSSYAYIYENVKENAPYINSLKENEDGNKAVNIAQMGINDTIFLGMFIDTLGTDYASKHDIVGGNAGLVVLRSSILNNNSKIEVVIDYCIKNPFDIFGIGLIKKKAVTVADGWLGEDYDEFAKNSKEDESSETEYVYITPDGSVYHKDSQCTYLTRDILSTSSKEIESKRNASGGIYYKCEYCKGVGTTVYYTSYGSRYHLSSRCSQLQRNVQKVPLESVSSRRPCSKCGGQHE